MSLLFCLLLSGYILICLLLIALIIMQKKRNAGLGSIAGVGQTYWDKNKKNSFEGKLEKYTKIFTGIYIIFTVVTWFVR